MHLLELLAALGAAQGFLLLVLIILRYRHHKSLPLALLLLAFSLRLGTIPSWNPQALIAHPWLFPATTPLPFLFGPLLWWAVRELARDTEARPRFLPLHFLPYAAETVAVTVTVLSLRAGQTMGEYVALVEAIFAGNPPLWLPTRNALKVGVNVIYVLLAARIAFGGAVRGIEAARRRWLRALVLVPVASLIPFAFVAVAPGATAGVSAGITLPFVILAAAMVLLIYTCTMLVLVTPGVPGCAERARLATQIAVVGRVDGRGVVLDGRRRGRGVVLDGRRRARDVTTSHHPASTDDDCLRLAARAGRELEGGAFRDPELSLQKLAGRLRVHPNRLSRAVNYVYGESYPSLLSRCRLDYFIRRVRTGCLDECNILELALDAGFPSKSSFNRVFKEHLGVAPSAFVAASRACSDDLPGLAIRPGRATMRGNGTSTNRSVQRHADPSVAGDAGGNGHRRGG
ncbi:MAG: helix-turn-helix domain-containing protein [Spirochaetes bacterium]|nr:helix-turn-helix domain-containing protein [Spirochaetota bacterium]